MYKGEILKSRIFMVRVLRKISASLLVGAILAGCATAPDQPSQPMSTPTSGRVLTPEDIRAMGAHTLWSAQSASVLAVSQAPEAKRWSTLLRISMRQYENSKTCDQLKLLEIHQLDTHETSWKTDKRVTFIERWRVGGCATPVDWIVFGDDVDVSFEPSDAGN